MKLKLGIPKGSLQEATVRMFKKAGFNINIGTRSYFPSIDDEEISPFLLRAQEMARYVADGALDAGITGRDWTIESGRDVVEVCELIYGKQGLRPVRWVLAVPNESSIKKPQDIKGKRIATELVNATRAYFKKKKTDVDIEFSWGATEAKVGAGLVDGIVELTETGASLKANNLRIVDTICESTTLIVANKASWKDSWKRQKIENIALLLQGAILAEEKVGLKMNVEEKNLNKILAILPAMKNPTISQLSKKSWRAIETIIDESVVRTLIPKLKQNGAQGIIEYPLNKVIY
ncbi:MAG: ATP phosphoribosyltransferase [Candidatus Omnitrophota bacterium]|nr:ATP phosphoribosyltransferase [Candidatus Omnitrophota bacterium]